MATVTSDRAGAGFPVFVGDTNALCVAYGSYNITSDPATGTIIEFCKLPKGATVVGGFLELEKALDSGGSETFELDIGWSGSTTALLNSGVITTTLRHNFTATNATDGFHQLTEDTTIIGTVVSPATFPDGGGFANVCVHYVMR